MSHATSASFIARVDSWIADDETKEQLSAGRIRRLRPQARHLARLVGVRVGHRRIGRDHGVRVVAELLNAPVPQVPHHVVVGADGRDGKGQPEGDREEKRDD